MSIKSEIDRIKQNIATAYSSISSKGGTVPTSKTSENLSTAISSIPQDRPTLYAPTISLLGDTLTISENENNGSFPNRYNIYSNGSLIWYGDHPQSINLKDLYSVEGTYTIKANVQGDNFNDSGFSNTVSYTYSKFTPPPKGALITLNLDGTNRTYRLLKINDTIAEIMTMFEVNTSIKFNSSGSKTYAGGTLDNYLNNTWYGTLTSTAKAAIVDKTFRQDSWYWGNSGNPDYSGYYGTSNPGTNSYTVSLGSTTYGSSITRHVYALSVQDVIDYVTDTSITDGKLQNYNIWKMFYNTTSQPSTLYIHWSRSASADYSDFAFFVHGDHGSLRNSTVTHSYACRPALQIDLSKIAFTVQ